MDKLKIIANIDVEACLYGFGDKEKDEEIEIAILELAKKLAALRRKEGKDGAK